LIYANLSYSPEWYVGFSLSYGIILAFVSILLYAFGIIPFGYAVLLFAIIFVLFEVLMHSILVIRTDNRTRFVEDMIPDFLRLLSSNIRSGFTIDKALLLSARPEFGYLEKEIRLTANETISGESAEGALKKMVDRFNSESLKRSMGLLAEGIMKGGNLPNLLDNLAEDLRQVKTLKKEVKSIVMMYVIFIFFASGVGAPLLYSVSGFLVTSMGEIGGKIDTSSIPGNAPFMKFKITEMDPGFLNIYSTLAILITSVFGGLLIGLVQDGSERAGLKFIPILLLISMSIYFVSKIALIGIFGKMF
jgi:flagellar protein FlaJ